MSLNGLLSVTMGLRKAEETAEYYADFGLTPQADSWFSTADAGRQLRIVYAPTRRLVEMRVGVDDSDDIRRAEASLARLGLPPAMHDTSLEAIEPVTGMRVYLDVAPRVQQDPAPAGLYNGPGRPDRQGRAPGFLRPGR